MASNESSEPLAKGSQKRRACDECRTRKLACSKEPAGCSRCKRDGIPCHYSLQKPMGRPRKRRLVEEPSADEAEGPLVENVVVPATSAGGAPKEQDVPSTAFVDSGLGFLDDSAASNLDLLNLLPYGYDIGSASFDPQILGPGDGAVDEAGFPLSLNGVDLLSGINFDDEPDSSAANMSKDISDSLQRYWQSQNLEPVEPPESISSSTSNSAGSPSSQPRASSGAPAKTLKASPSVACGCLSSLYLALDSLSRLPPDIIGAMGVARHATKVAHDVIKCPFCSGLLTDDPTKPPPIQCFQNLMCLAALVPSACNAYAAILEMVDKETAEAKHNNGSIWFSLQDLGGLWGTIGGCSNDCPQMAAFNNRHMKPDMWRTVMRALLRLDVYGFSDPPDDVATTTYKQDGLQDVVRLLEERSHKRHGQMDELVAAGKLPERSEYLLHQSYKPVPPEQRNCLVILEAARVALDNLVIA